MPEKPRDPMRAAQANMRPPALRRFYKRIEVVAADAGGFALSLDGRGARTPGKRPLIAPTRAVAERSPPSGPRRARRSSRCRCRHKARQFRDRRRGGGDGGDAGRDRPLRGGRLVCYRAEAPAALVALQADAYDPALDWARDKLGVRFAPPSGSSTSPAAAGGRRRSGGGRGLRRAVRRRRAPCDHEADRLGGAGARGGARAPGGGGSVAHRPCGRGFQNERWGVDAEAMARRAAHGREMAAAASVLAAIATR